jgi:superfamily II DNA/RNA helicase
VTTGHEETEIVHNGIEIGEEQQHATQGLSLGSIFTQSEKKEAHYESTPTTAREIAFNDTNSYETSEEITVTGRDAPKPFMKFSDYDWPQEIAHILKKENYIHPTPIQCQGLPIALEGRDLVGIAQTGSGKTLSYILPAVVKALNEGGRSRNPFALVLAPTRELAQQIYSVARTFPSLNAACLYGGSSKGHQIQQLQSGPKFVVATPGRLNDLMATGHVNVRDVSFLVLDEADRMLDMGFEPQIRQIIREIPRDRQTLMWSATWPEDVRTLAQDFLQDFIQVNIGSSDLHANHDIKQIVRVIHEEEKQNELVKILEEIRQRCEEYNTGSMEKTLIFAQTKRRVDAIANGLRRRKFRAAATHGDKSQSAREDVLRAYRSGKIDILVATDVAARGLDVNDIKVVVNYDYPNTNEDYVHRIGRTARAGNKGTAYTFFTSDNCAQAKDLIAVMEEAGQTVDSSLRQMQEMARREKKIKKSFREAGRFKDRFGSGFESRPYFTPRTNRDNDETASLERFGSRVKRETYLSDTPYGQGHGSRAQHRSPYSDGNRSSKRKEVFGSFDDDDFEGDNYASGRRTRPNKW